MKPGTIRTRAAEITAKTDLAAKIDVAAKTGPVMITGPTVKTDTIAKTTTRKAEDSYQIVRDNAYPTVRRGRSSKK